MKPPKITIFPGLSVTSWLGLIFVTLKLTGVINWSWWFVTLPFWGLTAFVLTLVLFYLAAAILLGAVAFFCEFFSKK